MKTVWHRIYEDFLMPSRLEEYRALLILAQQKNYIICSIADFWSMITKKTRDPRAKYLVLRHDIDSDPATARMMFCIESSLGIRSSYYFRLCTIDLPLMDEISRAGSEASYHYEEIATLAKRKRLKTREAVLALLPEAQSRFKNNLNNLRSQTGLPMTIVASHGDFVNVALKLYNWAILESAEFREEVNIELEVYDDSMMRHVTSRHSDNTYPQFWNPSTPVDSLNSGEPVIYLLTHPRHWRCAISDNLRDDVKRAFEGVSCLFSR